MGSTRPTAATAAIVSGGPLPEPAAHGLGKLTAALEGRGWECARATALPAEGVGVAVVALTPDSPRDLLRLAVGAGWQIPAGSEALGFCPLPAADGRPPLVLIA